MNMNHSAADLQHFNSAHQGLNVSSEGYAKAIEGFSACVNEAFLGSELSSVSDLA
jgi:hypothetical protein